MAVFPSKNTLENRLKLYKCNELCDELCDGKRSNIKKSISFGIFYTFCTNNLGSVINVVEDGESHEGVIGKYPGNFKR